MFNAYNHWRNTARPVRFFVIDARAGIFFLLFLLHIRLWTLIAITLVIVFFTVLERFGLTLPVAMRRIRMFFTGPYRPAAARLHRHHFVDRGGA